ncbi:MAG: PTS transporter subunit EIIB, partial [Vagococcus fluvialis]
MDYQKIASQILELVGTTDNVSNMTHCFTRLRFNLKDSSKANKEKLLETEGVISVVESGGQYQVVLGNKVEKVYDAMLPMMEDLNMEDNSKDGEKGSIGTRILNTIAAIFTPTVPAIAASGMLKGILAVAVIIATNYYQVDLKTYQTYIILNAASDALFYFMPIILGYSAAKVFKTNEYIAMIIGATLCYPAIVELMTGDAAVSLFSINLTKAS